MKHSYRIGLAVLVTGLFSACTHYTLPNDPTADQLYMDSSEVAAQGEPARRSAQPMRQQQAVMQPAAMQPSAMQPAVMQPVASNQSSMSSTECTSDDGLYINDGGVKRESVKVRSTGYGAPPKSFYPDPQRRLMAMRAAKIDAYRSLAERIYGVQIWGGTTLGDMVVERDRFRVYLDTHLRGARVVAENLNEDGSYETEVEVNVDQSLLGIAVPESKAAPCSEQRKPVKSSADGYAMSQVSYNDMKHRPDPTEDSSTSNFYYRTE